MLAIGLSIKNGPAAADRKWLSRACKCWLFGIVFFSGSLYWLALGGPRWLGPVTPLGGILLLAGWIGVIMDATKPHKTTSE